MKRKLFLLIAIFGTLTLWSQSPEDTILRKDLEAITISGYRPQMREAQRLPSVQRNFIFAGKKSEVITVAELPANLAEKVGRQVFAKIPGAFIYDMDGAGNQVNISTRGLDPHRSWEYNVRHNGAITNSDLYGYPASHFSPPMESVERIELIRGTASLQYGAGFGGMINYVSKSPDPHRPFSFESLNTIGSFGLMSTYNAIGGTQGKWSYHAYYQRRVSSGYRRNARSESEGQMLSLRYQASDKLSVGAELARSMYLHQVPGPLTDSMFAADPRQSTRFRNFFNPDIYVPVLRAEWHLTPKTSMSFLASAVLGHRSSVQFIGFADRPDVIDPLISAYSERQVDIDNFNSYNAEWRMTTEHRLGILAAGLQLTRNNLHRRQLGRGTTGIDYDLSLVEGAHFRRDVRNRTRNLAIFAEHLFQLTPKLSLSPGARMELGVSDMVGVITYLEEGQYPGEIPHVFPLFGVNMEYRLNAHNRIYGGISQAYRPVIFSDLIPANELERNDPNLRDASGHNLELGMSGQIKDALFFDLSFFQILYLDRIGRILEEDADGRAYFFKTNLGASRTNGLELYVEWKALRTLHAQVSLFTASSYFDGRYLRGAVALGGENVSVTGNRLESTPRWTSRNGLQLQYKNFASSLQYSFVDRTYSDALNTEQPSANGAQGIVPAYGLWDLNVSWRIIPSLALRLGAHNLANRQYFTKRPLGYPGGGVWPSDGRGFTCALGLRL
jgi:Fe(3+) dicitrate transport protein